MTLEEARAELMAKRFEGMRCRCCDQYYKVYKITITDSMARSFIALYQAFRRNGNQWIHCHQYLKSLGIDRSNTMAQLRRFGVIEKKTGPKEDGNPNNGQYRMTEQGFAWGDGETMIPKYVIVCNNETLGHEGPNISVQDALDTPFNYREMVRGP